MSYRFTVLDPYVLLAPSRARRLDAPDTFRPGGNHRPLRLDLGWLVIGATLVKR